MSPFNKEQSERLAKFCSQAYDATITQGLLDIPYSGKDLDEVLTNCEFPDIIRALLAEEITSPVAIYLAGERIRTART